MIEIGKIEALYRYPVKSMGGEALDRAQLGWHGLEGDRRLAFRRVGDRGGFPWLTATKLPELLLFTPVRQGGPAGAELPTHVRTPGGTELDLFGDELASEIGGLHGSAVEMTHLDRGIFDQASLSAIATATVEAVAGFVEQAPDVRRFRPNILIATRRSRPFEEDGWVGGTITFGEGESAARIAVTDRDERCAMINYDPDSAEPSPELLRQVVRRRNNEAGVYGTVIRRGRLEVGQSLYFEALEELEALTPGFDPNPWESR